MYKVSQFINFFLLEVADYVISIQISGPFIFVYATASVSITFNLFKFKLHISLHFGDESETIFWAKILWNIMWLTFFNCCETTFFINWQQRDQCSKLTELKNFFNID